MFFFAFTEWLRGGGIQMTEKCGQRGVGIYVSLRRKYILYDLHKRETKVQDDHKSKNSYIQSLDLYS